MPTLYRLDKEGGFAVADTAEEVTAYAAPGSYNAGLAATAPEWVAEAMLSIEELRRWQMPSLGETPEVRQQDSANMARVWEGREDGSTVTSPDDSSGPAIREGRQEARHDASAAIEAVREVFPGYDPNATGSALIARRFEERAAEAARKEPQSEVDAVAASLAARLSEPRQEAAAEADPAGDLRFLGFTADGQAHATFQDLRYTGPGPVRLHEASGLPDLTSPDVFSVTIATATRHYGEDFEQKGADMSGPRLHPWLVDRQTAEAMRSRAYDERITGEARERQDAGLAMDRGDPDAWKALPPAASEQDQARLDQLFPPAKESQAATGPAKETFLYFEGPLPHFDAYEVSQVVEWHCTDSRLDGTTVPGSICEPLGASPYVTIEEARRQGDYKADFWTVYGRTDEGFVDAIGDFPTEDAARDYLGQISGDRNADALPLPGQSVTLKDARDAGDVQRRAEESAYDEGTLEVPQAQPAPGQPGEPEALYYQGGDRAFIVCIPGAGPAFAYAHPGSDYAQKATDEPGLVAYAMAGDLRYTGKSFFILNDNSTMPMTDQDRAEAWQTFGPAIWRGLAKDVALGDSHQQNDQAAAGSKPGLPIIGAPAESAEAEPAHRRSTDTERTDPTSHVEKDMARGFGQQIDREQSAIYHDASLTRPEQMAAAETNLRERIEAWDRPGMRAARAVDAGNVRAPAPLLDKLRAAQTPEVQEAVRDKLAKGLWAGDTHQADHHISD
jgi:hypothetical protein